MLFKANILSLALILSPFAKAVEFYTTFSNSASSADSGVSILKSSGGHYMILGSYTNAAYSSVLLQLASNGTRIGHTHLKFDLSSPVNEIVEKSGNFIIPGSHSGYLSAAKLSSSLSTMWSVHITAAKVPASISEFGTSDTYVLLGRSDNSGFTYGQYDLFIARISSSGSVTHSYVMGGSSNESPYSVMSTSDGGVLITGDTNSFGSSTHRSIIAKLDSSFNIAWVKIWSSASQIYPYFIQQLSDGGYFYGGLWMDSGVGKAFYAKTDASGSIAFAGAIGTSSSFTIEGMGKTNDNHIVMTGSFNSKLLVLKFTEGGTSVFTRYVNVNYNMKGLSITAAQSGNGMVITGITEVNNKQELFVLQLDADGNSNDSSLPVISITPGASNLASSITVTDESGTSLYKSVTNQAPGASFTLQASPQSLNQSFAYPAGSYASSYVPPPPSNNNPDKENNGWKIAVGIIVPLVVIAVVVVVVICVIKKKKRARGQAKQSQMKKELQEADDKSKTYKSSDNLPNPTVFYQEDPNNHSSRPINYEESAVQPPQQVEPKSVPPKYEEANDDQVLNIGRKEGEDRI